MKYKLTKSTSLTLCLILITGLMVGLPGCLSEPTAPSDTAPSTGNSSALLAGTQSWQMQAYLVDQNGAVLEQMELPVSYTAWTEENGTFFCLCKFSYPEGTMSQFSGPLALENAAYPYGCLEGFSQEKGMDAGAPAPFYASFDPQLCAFIIDFDDDQNVYLLAVKDSACSAAQLWQHFQGFFAIRPENFPSVH